LNHPFTCHMSIGGHGGILARRDVYAMTDSSPAEVDTLPCSREASLDMDGAKEGTCAPTTMSGSAKVRSATTAPSAYWTAEGGVGVVIMALFSSRHQAYGGDDMEAHENSSQITSLIWR
jgi:hypothetical protein